MTRTSSSATPRGRPPPGTCRRGRPSPGGCATPSARPARRHRTRSGPPAQGSSTPGGRAARQLAVRLVAGGHGRTATVWLGWFPGRETPDVVAARVDGCWWDAARLAAAMPVPDLSIEGIVARLELTAADWSDVAAAG